MLAGCAHTEECHNQPAATTAVSTVFGCVCVSIWLMMCRCVPHYGVQVIAVLCGEVLGLFPRQVGHSLLSQWSHQQLVAASPTWLGD